MIRASREPITDLYAIQQELAVGFLGPTVLVTEKSTGKLMICKICRKTFIGGTDKLASFRQRLVQLKDAGLSTIVAYSDVIESAEDFFLIRPYIARHTLTEVIQAQPDKVLPTSIVLSVWKKLVNCVNELHQRKIYPSSLKPSNIFIDGNKNVIITDLYELSSDISWALQTQDPPQLAFLAPEFFNRKATPSSYSDVWSLGVILYFMTMKTLPWPTKNVAKMINKITESALPSLPIIFPSQIIPYIKLIFERDPGKRPPADVLLDTEKIRILAHGRRDSDPQPNIHIDNNHMTNPAKRGSKLKKSIPSLPFCMSSQKFENIERYHPCSSGVMVSLASNRCNRLRSASNGPSPNVSSCIIRHRFLNPTHSVQDIRIDNVLNS